LILSRLGWARKFDEPIALPKDKPLVTLRDAALYITRLPKTEHEAPEWQAAMEALLLVAEHRDGALCRHGLLPIRHKSWRARNSQDSGEKLIAMN
jgi:hypothetical protein